MDAVKVLKELERRITQRKLYSYKPYGLPETLCPDGELWRKGREKGWAHWSNKPWQLDFHNMGASCQERLLICANRVGKTQSNMAEVAVHMTGDYPPWWQGKRFAKPVLVWSGSPTNETSRDIVQKELLGGTDKENLGTGWIPKDRLIGRPKMKQAGVSDVVDTFKVRHASGGVSICVLKTYEQGWRKWQGTAPDVVSLDEEPEDFKIYTEALTRVLTSRGIMMTTFTPLLGQTDLVLHFERDVSGQYVGTATWEDAPHLNREERERMAAAYPDHEVQARTMGVPMMGEGRIFKQAEESVVIEPLDLPPHWARINGMDFGIDHPFGFAAVAWDRSRDILYVYDSERVSGGNIPQHAAILKRYGQWIPVSWPHDGLKRTQAARTVGPEIFKLYSRENVNMLSRSARYQNDIGGAQDQWIIIEEIKERERTGRIKYFKTCTALIEERRNYHTKDGKIVAVRDDALKAMFYAVMMRRYATTGVETAPPPMAAILTMRR